MALKIQKAIEMKVNESLYTGIYFLTQTYPPQKDFWEVFKKDMFVKQNRAAAQQVIYYLLHTLNPNIIKDKIQSWPILDNQYERQFRSEVTKYLNELNSLYENAKMPTIMASHFVSPGGFKFAKYMLKLSILVRQESMVEKLEKTNLILYSKHENDTDKRVKRLNILTSQIKKESENLKLNFLNKEMVASKVEAKAITDKLHELQKNTPLLQEKLATFQKEENDRFQYSDEVFNKKLELLEDGIFKIKNNCDKLAKLRHFLTYLSRDDLALEYKPKNTNDVKLDLISLFKKFNLEMEKYCLIMSVLSNQHLENNIERFSKCSDEMWKLQNELGNLKDAWHKLSNDVENAGKGRKTCKKVLELPSSTSTSLPGSGNSTVLAIPLDDS